MNIAQSFEGTGMREAGDAEAEKLADAVGEALAQDIPTATTRATSRRVMFERSIVKDRAEKREIQRRIAIDQAKLRQINISLRSSEDALDGILASEE